jgi:hypothetical protein
MQSKVMGAIFIACLVFLKAVWRDANNHYDLASDLGEEDAAIFLAELDASLQSWACNDILAFSESERKMNVVVSRNDIDPIELKALVEEFYADNPDEMKSAKETCVEAPAAVEAGGLHLIPGQ